MTTDRRNALAALAAAGLIWGLTVPMSKVAMGWLDPLWLTAARFAVAAPVLAFAARGSLRAAMTWRVAGWGVLFYAAVVGIQNVGVHMTSVSHGALICGSVPAFVALVALASGRGSAGPVAWSGFGIAGLGVLLGAGAGGGASRVGGGRRVVADRRRAGAAGRVHLRLLRGGTAERAGRARPRRGDRRADDRRRVGDDTVRAGLRGLAAGHRSSHGGPADCVRGAGRAGIGRAVRPLRLRAEARGAR